MRMNNTIGELPLLMIGCFLIFSLLVFLYRYRKSRHYQRAVEKQEKKKANALESQNPEVEIDEKTPRKDRQTGEISGHFNRDELFKETPAQEGKISQPETQEVPFCSEHFEIIQSITKTDAVDIPAVQEAQPIEMPDEAPFDADEIRILDIKETQADHVDQEKQ